MKNIIVREYLESLTESEELDVIFPILLESMGFRIVSTPKITKGLLQYGKDVIAVRKDGSDKTLKRYHFELKGGKDRNINSTNFHADDGVRESIRDAKLRTFNHSGIPKFNSLPIKVILVHNGVIKEQVRQIFDEFIKEEFPQNERKGGKSTKPQFESWDIFELSKLFTKHLFSEYLLTDDKHVQRLKKVLVLLNNSDGDFTDFGVLINELVEKLNATTNKRKQRLVFESINLVAFVVYSYAKHDKNLEYPKKCLPYVLLRLWSWIIEANKLADAEVMARFDKIYRVYLRLLNDYFDKLIPVAILRHGLSSDSGGRYEQVGYPIRTLEFISYYIFYHQCLTNGSYNDRQHQTTFDKNILTIIKQNVASRPLFDDHSIPIFLLIETLLSIDNEKVKSYIRELIHHIQAAYRLLHRLPDANNNIENVIRLSVTGEKSVYYMDETSLLMGMLSEYLAILDMEKEYDELRGLVMEAKIDVAIFIPFSDVDISKYMPDEMRTLEARLFSKPVHEGYQSEIQLEESFADFKAKTGKKNEGSFSFVTSTTKYSSLLTLAHIFYKTPFFPDRWRGRTDT